jgi:cell division protein FtsQ
MVVTNVPGADIVNGLGVRRKIVALATAIHADSFWNAQVSGVALDSVGMFELTPVLGEHKILFGDTARMQEKFDNLLAFYKNVLNRIGWDKYEVLDVRYRNQVIASPSLPYKGPVDKAIESMNWISSIEETEAKKREKDSVADVERRYQAALQAGHHKAVPKQVKPVAVPPVAKKQDKPAAKAAIKPAAKVVAKKAAAKLAAKKKSVAKHADKKQKAVNKGNNKQEKSKQVPKYEYGASKQKK